MRRRVLTYTVYYDDFFSTGCRLGSSGPSFCEELATDLTATTYTHTTPDATRNYYWVVACNNYGCSAIDSTLRRSSEAPHRRLRPTKPTNTTTVEPSSSVMGRVGGCCFLYGLLRRLLLHGLPPRLQRTKLLRRTRHRPHRHHLHPHHPRPSQQLLLGRRLQQLRLLTHQRQHPRTGRRHPTRGSGQPNLRTQQRRSHRPQLGRVGRRHLLHRLLRRLLLHGLPPRLQRTKLLRRTRHRPHRHHLHPHHPRPSQQLLLGRRLQQLRMFCHRLQHSGAARRFAT